MKKIILILLILLTMQLFSQNSESEDKKPGIGLVLAGGGAWGFAHVGVLRILEEQEIPISYITGTSIGSIIGSLYAMGYSVDDLENLIKSQNWFDILNDEIDRKDISALNKNSFQDYLLGFSVESKKITLPGGIIDGQKIDYLLSRLHWDAMPINNFNELPIPFSCVATDIKTGRPVVLNSGDLTDSVRASMSIPGVFTPISIDDNILVDGMFVMNLPVTPVIEMGADVVIAVNFDIPETGLADYSTVTGALFQSFLLNMNMSIREQLPLADVIISPDIEGFSTFNYDMVDEIYEKGLTAAREKVDELKQYSDPVQFKKMKAKQLKKTKYMIINEIEVVGVNSHMAESLKKLTGLKNDRVVALSNSVLEEKIKLIYSVGLFDLVTYKQFGNKLIINIKKKESNVLGVAVNYDFYDNVSLLLNLKSRFYSKLNLFSDLNIRLGEKKDFRERLSVNLGFVNLIGLFSETNITLDKYPITSIDHLGSSTEFRSIFGAGLSLSKYFFGSISGGYDRFIFENIEHNTAFLQLSLIFDTLDKSLYPWHGSQVEIHGKSAIPTEAGSGFSRATLKTQFVIPIVYDNFSLFTGINGGILLNNDTLNQYLNVNPEFDIPLNHNIYIGGLISDNNSIPLIGYRRFENNFPYSLVINSGAQFQIHSNVIFQLKYDIATLSNSSDNLFKDYYWGYGVVAGVITPFGPLELSISGNNNNNFSFNLNLGYKI